MVAVSAVRGRPPAREAGSSASFLSYVVFCWLPALDRSGVAAASACWRLVAEPLTELHCGLFQGRRCFFVLVIGRWILEF